MSSRFAQILILSVSISFARAGTNEIQFNRDIRPILSENCYACHGPDKNQRKAKLRLDVREVALEKEAIVPGKPDQSKLVQHIFSSDPEEIMPPPKTGKALTTVQKQTLRQWIAAGAEYEPHWAYIKPGRFPVPAVQNKQWLRNPIDVFVLHALEEKNIKPSPEADRRTLLRRLSLDLIGLPPTPDEVAAFLTDKRPDAYERQVNRLLSSSHYGERMAVPWLDVVRFADTVGYHGDQNQDIFPYRDYVINAFNRNKPFDQFTIEQLAGDLLPNQSVEAQVASGFNRLNMMTREGGAQPKEYLAKYAADRVRTVSMAWLGSTMGCAECHDHKFDPFSTKDFYSMEAFFADLKQWGVYENYGYTPEPELEGIDNDGPFPPEIESNSEYLHQRLAKLQTRLDNLCSDAVRKFATERDQQKSFDLWRKSSLTFLKQAPTGWVGLKPEGVILRLKDTNAVAQTNFFIQSDGAVGLTEQPRESLKLTLPLSNMWLAAIRLEVVPQPVKDKDPVRKYRRGPTLALSATLKSKDDETKLSFYDAEADHKRERYINGHVVVGVKDSWQISLEDGKQSAVWLLSKPIQVKEGDQLIVNPGNGTISSFRVSVSPFAAEDPLKAGGGERLRKALAKASSRAALQRQPLAAATYFLSGHLNENAMDEARRTIREMRLCRNGRAYAMVSLTRERPTMTRVLPRGNWQDESGEIVQPAVPHFLAQIPNPDGRRLTRLDLARWLVSPDNPLTARAVVNRLWKQFFGTGLSAVVDDLGVQGDWPVHPELLDWLACEFMQPVEPMVKSSHGSTIQRVNESTPWNLKHMVRLIVTSSTYRQDSNQRNDLKEIDPNNRLLAAQSPRRLEAEFVRDNALSIAGLINLDLGGPSAFPYQPAGYYANIQFPDRDYYPSKDERQYRRGVYSHWQRTFLHPMLANFDAPSREECTANRVVSNTPQQALTLLNDPTFLEASRVFAAELLTSGKRSDEQRLDAAFEKALSREPRLKERQSLLKFLSAQREHYQHDTDEASKLMAIGNAPASKSAEKSDLAAWTQVCRVILNLQETITRY